MSEQVKTQIEGDMQPLADDETGYAQAPETPSRADYSRVARVGTLMATCPNLGSAAVGHEFATPVVREMPSRPRPAADAW